MNGNLANEERLGWLRNQLNEHGSVQISEAAAQLDVSEMTIRRDLEHLEGVGVVRRVRGGAVAVGPAPFGERHRRQAKAKAQIAAKLVRLVPASGAIGLDGSSTVLRLATKLESARDLTVVTHGVETFQALQSRPGISPLLTGGALDHRTGTLIGPLACRAARGFSLTRLFVSAAGVDAALGATETTIDEAEVKRSLADAAGEIILAVDASKLGARAVAVGLEWDRISILVTELAPADARLRPYRDLVKVV